MQTGDSNLELYGFAEISETALCSLTLANDQLDGQTFLIQLLKSSTRTFRPISCSASGGQIVLIQHLVSSLSVSDCLVHRLRLISRRQAVNLCIQECLHCSSTIYSFGEALYSFCDYGMQFRRGELKDLPRPKGSPLFRALKVISLRLT